MPSRPTTWWLKARTFLQDEPKDDDPVDAHGAAGAAPVKREQEACSDLQGPVLAEFAVICKKMPWGACPEHGVASHHSAECITAATVFHDCAPSMRI